MTWISASGGSAVELAALGDGFAMRNAGEPDGAVLCFTAAEINAFLLGVKDGEFDDLVAPPE
ncbi:hypothetical protein Aph01nite_56590 [Acrocarpospora phusangensis]|uniref:DUF397 domain-containing protein n=1 Tax=Acrocarpospora phusangensis TaxID=1070424 RepID=A0A919UMX4_9ACTN|nr:DUF397 domain-containing protein [Acrocarpospora phusangensis]GIH27349.1 hypothetical protein Aph01nite_56590 [Acrocarpospora phusangensis]